MTGNKSSVRHREPYRRYLYLFHGHLTVLWRPHDGRQKRYVGTRMSWVLISNTNFWLMFCMCLSSLCMHLDTFEEKDGNHGRSCSRCRSDQRYSSGVSGKNRLHGINYMVWLVFSSRDRGRYISLTPSPWTIDHIFHRDVTTCVTVGFYSFVLNIWPRIHELWKHGFRCWSLIWMPAQWTTLKLVINLIV